MSRSVLAVQDMNLLPMVRAAACTSVNWLSASGLFGFTSMAIMAAWEPIPAAAPTASSPARGDNRATREVTTRPIEAGDKAASTGSLPMLKTIGIVVVAALAASAGGSPPFATITATWRRTRSAANAGSRSYCLRPAILDRHVLTLDIAGSRSDPGGTRRQGARRVTGDQPLRNPITGIAGCCARAASGHAAAAPPRSVMNSRRFTA